MARLRVLWRPRVLRRILRETVGGQEIRHDPDIGWLSRYLRHTSEPRYIHAIGEPCGGGSGEDRDTHSGDDRRSLTGHVAVQLTACARCLCAARTFGNIIRPFGREIVFTIRRK